MKSLPLFIAVALICFLTVLPVMAANHYNFVTHYNSYEQHYIPDGSPLQPAEPQKTVIPRPYADWQLVQQYFPRYSDAVIRDIITGRTFNVRRTFGGFHADVETLTKADTQIMYEIWGGWSWDRRAVVVYIGDYAFAGSLAGMPHAGVDSAPLLAIVDNRSGGFGRGQNFDMIPGNGMDGHVCLHFAGSRIHGSGVINAAHQYRVREAAAHIQANY